MEQAPHEEAVQEAPVLETEMVAHWAANHLDCAFPRGQSFGGFHPKSARAVGPLFSHSLHGAAFVPHDLVMATYGR